MAKADKAEDKMAAMMKFFVGKKQTKVWVLPPFAFCLEHVGKRKIDILSLYTHLTLPTIYAV